MEGAMPVGDELSGLRIGKPANAPTDPDPISDYGHFPYARPLRLGWQHDATGKWNSPSEDHKLWEVFCAECGDTDGPADQQSQAVQRLRGPYPSEPRVSAGQTGPYKIVGLLDPN